MNEQSTLFRYSQPNTIDARRGRREMSFEAQVLWQALRSRRLMDLKFRRKCSVEGYIVDFFCFSKRLVIELRGSACDEDGEFDSYKDLTLASAGIRIIRFTNSEVRYQLPKVLQRVHDACVR